MKRRLFSGAVLVICLSLMAYGTIAYFTASDIAHNVITSGEVDITLLEWADEDKTTPFPEDGVSGVVPGAKVTKIVEVQNTGSSAAYVRVKLEKAIRLAAGINAEPNMGLMQFGFDNEAWTLMEDGFYYYNDALEPGETTLPLLASITFDKEMDNNYQNSTATVDVSAYATQVANNGATVFDAAGWPTV